MPLSAQSVIALGFACLIILVALLLMLPVSSRNHTWTNPLTALFTATSAVCVTGLAVVDTAAHWSLFGQFIILISIQIGGLGVMTVMACVLILLGKRVGLRQRTLLAESISSLHIGGIIRLTRCALLVTLILEGLGAFLLSFRFVPFLGPLSGIWYSIFHAVSAFCNAGFDLFGVVSGPYTSLESFTCDPLIMLTVAFLILAGGLGFFVYYDLLACRFHFRRMKLHTRAVLLLTPILILLPFVLFFALERGASMRGMDTKTQLLASLFLAVSPRTAGFSAVSLSALSPAGVLLTFLLMLVGGNPGSTAGGTKTTTMLVLLLTAVSTLQGKEDVCLLSRRLPDDLIRRASSIVITYLLLIVSSTLIICSLQSNLPLVDILLEVSSAINTVGMSTGVTRSLIPLSRMILIMLMYIGRLGSLTFSIVIVHSAFPSRIRRPVDRILIG